ncbi:Dynein light chain [Paramicrosporidium saccamoebae]|uniref:Dynein light chain n=1 Tax=Paramicrosporidium saccamoebae TaxID=1246581 RepID=A0A2H9TK45_9FUNG|nr:Dynein light chain [Paramicrosporidium saccamoebae]
MQPEVDPAIAAVPVVKEEARVQIKNVDMPEEMQQRAVELAKEAVQPNASPREIAGTIKREFDKIYGPAWHCIVGKAFGSFVTHGTRSGLS